MNINARDYDNTSLNKVVRESKNTITINDCLGERFIGAGTSDLNININGIPGNALGAYLNGSNITVNGNAQDAVGDTMNAGRIAVFGNAGDAVGYAMRGGKIFIKGNAGYRAGIHMKAYTDKLPIMIIGGRCGSFLGEYQAGGIIIVLGMHDDNKRIVGNFPCTGMHGGMVFFRSDCKDVIFPSQVNAKTASESDISLIKPYLDDYCNVFGLDSDELCKSVFTVVTPNSANPYKQMYVEN